MKKRNSNLLSISAAVLIGVTVALMSNVNAQSLSKESAPSIACAGDGKQDDSDCLQKLLNDAKTVKLMRGRTYLISKSLQLRAGEELDGNHATVLTIKPLRAIIISGDGVRVHDLKLIAAGPIHSYGIVLDTGASNVTLQDNRIVGNFVQAILFGAADQHDLNFIRNTISPSSGYRPAYGILGNPGALMTSGAFPTGIVIRKNVITNVSSDAIELNAPSPKELSNIVIEGNTLSAPFHVSGKAGFCIGMAGARNVRIYENILSNCKWQGIHIEDHSTNVTISGNTINKTIGRIGSETDWPKNSSGILLINSSGIKIYNNQIKNTANAGIDLLWNPKGANSDVTIAGNDISNSGDFGIRIAGQSATDYNVVIGNPTYGRNRIVGSKVSAVMSCVSTVKGADAPLRTCGKN